MPSQIPPAWAGTRVRKVSKNTLRYKLKQLAVGEYITLPLSKRSQVGWHARALGYKLVTRQMGSEDSFRCYRSE